MKRHFHSRSWSVAVLVIIVSMLAACAGAPVPTVEQPTAKAPQQATVAPTAAPAATSTTAPTTAATTQAADQPKDGGTLYLWSPASWPVPEATRFYGWEDEMIREPAYEALLAFDKDLNMVPGLAQTWDISPDGKEYTFHLRKGVKFQDGQPFTAADVKFSVELYYNPKMVPAQTAFDPSQQLLVGYEDYVSGAASEITGIKVIDDLTVKFSLTEPHAAFLNSLSPGFWIRMMPKHIWGSVDPAAVNKDPRWTTPIATGPFQIVKFVPEQYVEYKRFDDYWGGKPHIEKIIMKISNVDVALAQLERGEMDYVVNVPPTEVDRIKSLKDVTVVSAPNMTWGWGLYFNYKQPLWRDQKARQAIMYVANRQGYVDSILMGQGIVLNHIILMPPWAQSPDVPQYPFDPAKAKQLLQEAGYDFKRPINLWYFPGVKERIDYAPIFQAAMKDIGVEVVVTSIETAQLTERVFDDEGGAWDVMISGTQPQFDPSATESYYGTNGDQNLAWFMFSWNPPLIEKAGKKSALEFNDNWAFSNPKVDELYKQGRSEPDANKRAAIYQEIDKLLAEDVPVAFYAEKNYVDTYNTRIQGVTMSPNTNRRFFGIANWWLSK